MKTVKVTFANGDYLVTRINGTDEKINEYYLGRYFNLGVEDDDMQLCVSVDFLPEKPKE